MNRIVALFKTTRSAIRAERLCKQEGIKCKMVPVPREFSSECGMAIEFDQSMEEQPIRILFEKEQIIATFHIQS